MFFFLKQKIIHLIPSFIIRSLDTRSPSRARKLFNFIRIFILSTIDFYHITLLATTKIPRKNLTSHNFFFFFNNFALRWIRYTLKSIMIIKSNTGEEKSNYYLYILRINNSSRVSIYLHEFYFSRNHCPPFRKIFHQFQRIDGEYVRQRSPRTETLVATHPKCRQ